VATQPSFVASKGIHGSTLFTLSLPVTRLRLLSVRAAIGWLEGSGVIAVLCCALWFRSPALRAMVGRERCCTMPHAHCLWLRNLLRVGIAGDFSRRAVANLGNDAYLYRALVAFCAHFLPCLPGHL